MNYKTKMLAIGCMSMSMMLPLSVSAAQETISVSTTIPSTYTVEIPKTIALSSTNNGVNQFAIQTKGNIAPNETIIVSSGSEIVMTREGDSSYTGKATININSQWGATSIHPTNPNSKNSSITFPEVKAGKYTGTIMVDVKLQEEVTFNIDKGSSYKAIKGMTWEQFTKTDQSFSIKNGKVHVMLNDTDYTLFVRSGISDAILPSDVITDGQIVYLGVL